MNIVLVLKIICAVVTIIVGIVSVVKPTSVYEFTGLQATGPRGITEIRAVLGALFIGLGLAPFLLKMDPAAFRAGGIAYLAVGVVRLASMYLDKSLVQSNWISLAFEIAFGIILIL